MKFFTALLLATLAVAAPTPNTNPNSNAIRSSDSCVSKSTGVSNFTANDFTFKYTVTSSGDSASYDAEASFTLGNAALDYKAKCTGKSHSKSFFNGKITYECNSGDRSDEATFSYNHSSGDLSITQDWSCASEGARFSASGDAATKLSCKTTKAYGKKTVVCSPKTFVVPIKQISAVA